MKKVVFFTDPSKFNEALDFFEHKSFSGKKVPFKLHMGEKGNKFYPKPEIVEPFIDVLKKKEINPFFYDTTVAYSGMRHIKKDYERLAEMHGYTNLGCKVVIDDSGKNIKVEGREYEVADTIVNSSHIISFAHVKGHIATGMGGAIKNFGMGGVTKETKLSMHHASRPIYQKDKCTFCGVCAEVCVFDGITVKKDKWTFNKDKCFGCGVCVENCQNNALSYKQADFQYWLACAAKACVQDKNVIYINDVNRISKSCDCDPLSGPEICPDIGYLVSDDIVAIDKASLDLVHDIKPDVFEKENKVSPFLQIKHGEDVGLGSSKYQLIKI